MTNYRQQDVIGQEYVRAKRVIIENPKGGVPGITFVEEAVLVLQDRELRNQTGVLTADMANPQTVFSLLNPADDSVIGSMTYQDIYVMLYSLHRHLSATRVQV